jgi:potassium/hydrogen antiporter
VEADARLILACGALMAAGLLVWLVADRFRAPFLVLILGLGMAIGSDGAGWIHFGFRFEDYGITRSLGTVALAVILFEAGLASGIREIRPVLGPGIGLAVVGTLVTAVVAGLAAAWLFHLPVLEGLLLGSILASTDGAAVFSLLRGISLRPRLARTLEAEAGLNDPVAVLLVIGLIELIREPGFAAAGLLRLFAVELAVGAAIGAGVGWVVREGLRRVPSAPQGVHLVGPLAALGLAYGAAATLHGSGFLAAYLAGLLFGSVELPAEVSVKAFFEGLAAVAEIGLFFVLGLLVFPGQLRVVLWRGTLLALVVALVARPAGAVLATAFAPFSLRERLLLGWAGLRGAVPVVLATFPVIEHVPRSIEFFNIAFFVVLVSTLVQGLTVEPLARRLGLVEHPVEASGAAAE